MIVKNWSKNLTSVCKTSGSAALVKLCSEIQASTEGPHKGMKGLGSSWVQLCGCLGYIWVAASGRILPKLFTSADSGTHQGGLFSYLLHEVKACANALTQCTSWPFSAYLRDLEVLSSLRRYARAVKHLSPLNWHLFPHYRRWRDNALCM